MKLKKILAAVAAAAVAVSTMAVSAFAESVLDSEFVVDTSWSKVAVIGADKFPNAAEGDTVAVTFTIDAADYNLVKLGKGTDWNGLECSSKAVNDADPGFKNQDDGNAVVTVDGTNVYTFTAADAEMAKANGIIVGGYSVTIKSVEYTPVSAAEPAAEAEAAPAAVAYDVNTVMVMQDNATWTNQKSAEVAITGEGEFTYSLSGLSIDPNTVTVLYIKDAKCIEETASGYQSNISDINLEYKSLKINGADVAIKDGAQTAIKDGIFDFALYNTWADSFIDLPTDTITSVELTVAISAAAAAPAAVEETTAPVEEAPEAEEAVDEDVDEDIDIDVEEEETEAEPVADTEAPAVEEAPAPVVENATSAPATGNTATASIVAVMAVAGVAAIAAKKRK